MTSASVAAALGRIVESDEVRTLTALAAELRRLHPGDPDAATIARHAELKRRRIAGPP